jgi:hypothetical protein
MRNSTFIFLVLAAALAGSATAQNGAESANDHHSQAAGEDHGVGRPMGGMHSMVRHHYVMRDGIPEAYRDLTNPLTATESVLANGQRIYAETCSTCHGETGDGDGPAGAALDPPPSNIRHLPRMPIMSSDAYLYWTVAEGGEPVQTGMLAFRQVLTSDDIWSVILYLREGL